MSIQRICLILLIIGALIFISCSSSSKPLRLGLIRPSLNHLPVDVAWQQQYLNKENYTIHYFASGWETNEALVHGQIDIAIFPFTYVWSDAAHQHNVKILSFLERESDGIIAHQSIATIQDLQGKKLGVLRASTLDILAEMFLEKHQLSMEMVYFRTPMDLASALQAGDVDAVSFYVPSIFRFPEKYTILHWYADDDPYHPCCNVTARGQALQTKQTEINQFMAGLEKACNFIETHPYETLTLACEVFQMNREQMAASLQHLHFRMGLEEEGRRFVERAGQWMQSKNYVETAVDAQTIYASPH